MILGCVWNLSFNLRFTACYDCFVNVISDVPFESFVGFITEGSGGIVGVIEACKGPPGWWLSASLTHWRVSKQVRCPVNSHNCEVQRLRGVKFQDVMRHSAHMSAETTKNGKVVPPCLVHKCQTCMPVATWFTTSLVSSNECDLPAGWMNAFIRMNVNAKTVPASCCKSAASFFDLNRKVFWRHGTDPLINQSINHSSKSDYQPAPLGPI